MRHVVRAVAVAFVACFFVVHAIETRVDYCFFLVQVRQVPRWLRTGASPCDVRPPLFIRERCIFVRFGGQFFQRFSHCIVVIGSIDMPAFRGGVLDEFVEALAPPIHPICLLNESRCNVLLSLHRGDCSEQACYALM